MSDLLYACGFKAMFVRLSGVLRGFWGFLVVYQMVSRVFCVVCLPKSVLFTTAFKKDEHFSAKTTRQDHGAWDNGWFWHAFPSSFWNKPINYLQASAEQRNLIYFYLPSFCLCPHDRETEQTQGTVREAKGAVFSLSLSLWMSPDWTITMRYNHTNTL